MYVVLHTHVQAEVVHVAHHTVVLAKEVAVKVSAAPHILAQVVVALAVLLMTVLAKEVAVKVSAALHILAQVVVLAALHMIVQVVDELCQ